MIKIIKEIRVEVSKPNLFQAIVAKQYDMNSRYLKATFVSDGVVLPIVKTSSVLVSINAKRSDGESRAFYGEVNDDNTVLVPIDSWMLSLDGEVTCDISVIEVDASTNVEKRLTSTTFTLLVEKAVFNIDDGEISDEEQENFINGLIVECQTATAAANAVASECREFIAANALKGNASGNGVIRIDDVSPLEHEIAVGLTPYVNANGAKVTRYEKNLCNPYDFTLGQDWNGPPNPSLAVLNMPCLPNTSYTISWSEEAKNKVKFIIEKISTTATTSNNTFDVSANTDKSFTTQPNTNCICVLVQDLDFNYLITYDFVESLKTQIEIGTTVTEYEPFKEPTEYIADENGIVKGVTSVYPTTTLIADNGVSISAEYNRDINKAFAELMQAIAALKEG